MHAWKTARVGRFHLLKTISLALAITTAIMLPVPAGAAFATGLSAIGLQIHHPALGPDPSLMEIPAEWGKIDETFTGHTGKLVVLIQDAHTNYDAQSRIAEIIQHFTKDYQIDLVASEAAEGTIQTELFRAFPVEETKKSAMERLMREGRIGGAQYSAIVSAEPFDFVGVDKLDLYKENVAQFLAVLDIRRSGESFIRSAETAIDQLKTVLYTKDQRALDDLMKRQESGRADLARFLAELHHFGISAGVSIESFVEISRFFEWAKKPEVALLDPERLLREIEQFTLLTQQKLARSNESHRLIQLEAFISLLKHGYALELTRKDISTLTQLSRKWPKEKILSFLESETAKYHLRASHVRALTHWPLAEHRARMFAFYETARKREDAFVKLLKKEMSLRLLPSSILVTGGFHKEGITARLRSAGISYAVITPAIKELTDHEHYLSLMRESGRLLNLPSRNTIGLFLEQYQLMFDALFQNLTDAQVVEYAKKAHIEVLSGADDPELYKQHLAEVKTQVRNHLVKALAEKTDALLAEGRLIPGDDLLDAVRHAGRIARKNPHNPQAAIDVLMTTLNRHALRVNTSAGFGATAVTSGLPDNMVNHNARMIEGDAFREIVFDESGGGNAGAGYRAVNGVADRAGKILAFGNYLDKDPRFQSRLDSNGTDRVYRFAIHIRNASHGFVYENIMSMDLRAKEAGVKAILEQSIARANEIHAAKILKEQELREMQNALLKEMDAGVYARGMNFKERVATYRNYVETKATQLGVPLSTSQNTITFDQQLWHDFKSLKQSLASAFKERHDKIKKTRSPFTLFVELASMALRFAIQTNLPFAHAYFNKKGDMRYIAYSVRARVFAGQLIYTIPFALFALGKIFHTPDFLTPFFQQWQVLGFYTFALWVAAHTFWRQEGHELAHVHQYLMLEEIRQKMGLDMFTPQAFQDLVTLDARQRSVHAAPMVNREPPDKDQYRRIINGLFYEVRRALLDRGIIAETSRGFGAKSIQGILAQLSAAGIMIEQPEAPRPRSFEFDKLEDTLVHARGAWKSGEAEAAWAFLKIFQRNLLYMLMSVVADRYKIVLKPGQRPTIEGSWGLMRSAGPESEFYSLEDFEGRLGDVLDSVARLIRELERTEKNTGFGHSTLDHSAERARTIRFVRRVLQHIEARKPALAKRTVGRISQVFTRAFSDSGNTITDLLITDADQLQAFVTLLDRPEFAYMKNNIQRIIPLRKAVDADYLAEIRTVLAVSGLKAELVTSRVAGKLRSLGGDHSVLLIGDPATLTEEEAAMLDLVPPRIRVQIAVQDAISTYLTLSSRALEAVLRSA